MSRKVALIVTAIFLVCCGCVYYYITTYQETLTFLYSKIDVINNSIDENKQISDDLILSLEEEKIVITCVNNCEYKAGEYLTYSLSTPFNNILNFQEEKAMKIYFSLLMLD